jgi:diguanylate cyclase (GGDEF)-like protein
LLLIGATATPVAMMPLLPIPGFMTAFGAAMIVINILLAAILFSRGAIERRRDATALGAAYLYVAMIFLPLVASFPGGIVSGQLIGEKGSSVWLWLFWHGGFAVAILNYTFATAVAAPRRRSAWRQAALVLAAVIVVSIIGTTCVNYLPPTLQNGKLLFAGTAGVAPLAILGLLIIATFRVACMRLHTPERVSLTVAMVAACLDVWLTYQGTDRFALGWYLSKCGSLFTSLVVLISLLHQINFLYSRAATANGVLADLARHDGLTALLNRRGLDEAIGLEWRSSQRDLQPLSLLMIDVDYFKRFNDQYGHPAGDECLRQIAIALLAVSRRPRDIAARYGGEEFALLLPFTDSFGAVEMALRVRAAIRALAIPHAGSPHGVVSVSIGISAVPAADETGAASLVAAADRALYRAKEAGRDAICSSDDHAVTVPSQQTDHALPSLQSAAVEQPGRFSLPRVVGAVPTALYALQCEVLEAVASGQPLPETAHLLSSKVQRLAPGVLCAIMVIDGQGCLRRLTDQGAANASVADTLALALDGQQIGPDTGPFGAAAWYGAAIEVHDLTTDTRWQAAPSSEIARAAGLLACWCNPIKGRDGRVIGVVAFYYKSCRAPTAFERNLVDTSLHLLALAIDREEVWSRLRDANERFDAALSNMSQGLSLFEGDRLVVANRRYCEIYGLDPDAVTPGMSFADILNMRIAAGSGPQMPSERYLDWRGSLNKGSAASRSIVELQNGRVIAINHQPMPNAQWVSTHEDITDRRRAEAQIVHIARHDPLTGLPNRMLFDERLQQAVALSVRGQRCAAICLDIDNFKAINDTFGHPAGDQLLRGVSDRLRTCVRDRDTVARIGGDEFAVLMMGLERPDGAAELAKRIIRAMRKPIEIGDTTAVVTVSIGIALAPEDGSAADKLLKCADTALHRAKLDQRGAYRFFEAEMDARLQTRFELERDLRQALHNREFHLVYQPQFNLAANEISGFEALIRWNHPVRGLISPANFIPLAEETGLIVKLGIWVLQQACAEAATWPEPVKVAVNLSGLQLKAGGLVDTVNHALSLSGLDASRLELEITESVLLNNSLDTLNTLHALRALGVSIAMDDFGTGYSSLSYLRSFPFDKIKIDQTFIRDITEDQDSTAIIRAVVSLGRSLGMVTTAEGVETEAQLAQLRHEGCNEIQGYWLSRPVAPDAVPRMLTSTDAQDRMSARLPAKGGLRLVNPAPRVLSASV